MSKINEEHSFYWRVEEAGIRDIQFKEIVRTMTFK